MRQARVPAGSYGRAISAGYGVVPPTREWPIAAQISEICVGIRVGLVPGLVPGGRVIFWVYRLITVQARVAQRRPRSPGTGPYRQHWCA